MPLDLILVRHGESEGNVANHATKHGDDSHFTDDFLSRHSSLWRLTDKGIEQAIAAGAWIRANLGAEFGKYYVSEYLRAKETAAHLALPTAAWFPSLWLRERDWGALDSMTQTERQERYAFEIARRTIDPFHWTPPHGESMAQLCLRVDRVLGTLHREADSSAIVVCHGEVMQTFRVLLERQGIQTFIEIDRSKDPLDEIHNCSILHYTRRDPESGEISPYLSWMRSTCPWDLSLSANTWQPIVRRRFSNDALLAECELTTRLVHDV